jgi:dipeptidyl aminopeptidase/acylaminoacyl peptidase
VQARARRLLMVAGSPTQAPMVVELDLARGSVRVLARSMGAEGGAQLDARYLSPAQAIVFPTQDGGSAHAFYYPPTNPDFEAPPEELPPLLVLSHGGPTGAADPMLDLSCQYWTSRGFAVVDVNYRGSTGYGRAYRQLIESNWGVFDLDDCVGAARDLVKRGKADPDRLAVRGGSAGGYTTLCALSFSDAFATGASYYGVADLARLDAETHKFESRYLERLVPRDQFAQRSPINFTGHLQRPMIIFQGLQDHVVPPNQAEMMAEALRRRGVPFALLTFEDEGHGFRRAENLRRALEAELYFYSRILGFPLSESVEPVTIENLGLSPRG